MDLFLRIFKHLLPRARAWSITLSKRLREFFQGLTVLGDDIKEFFDLVWLDIFPATTRQISEWERQFGLPNNISVEQDRRDRLLGRWRAIGGQSPSYLQGVVQDSGFELYVYDWWEPDTLTAVPRNPLELIKDDLVFLYDVTSGDGESTTGGEGITTGSFLDFDAMGYLLVNKINTVYSIPHDSTKWPFFLYYGSSDFPYPLPVVSSRKNTLETLVLKISPAHLWLGMLVRYYDSLVPFDTQQEYAYTAQRGDISDSPGFAGIFKKNGTRYITVENNLIVQKDLGTAYDTNDVIKTVTVDKTGDAANATQVWINDAGSILYLLDGPNSKIWGYTLSVADQIESISALSSQNNDFIGNFDEGIIYFQINTTENDIVLHGSHTGGVIARTYEFNTSPNDITALTFTSQETVERHVAASCWKPDGTRYYTVTSDCIISEYILATAWDTRTVVKVTQAGRYYNASGIADITGMEILSDGSLIYLSSGIGREIFGFPMTTGWELSTLAEQDSTSLDLTSSFTYLDCFYVEEVGERLYMAGSISVADDAIRTFAFTNGLDDISAAITIGGGIDVDTIPYRFRDMAFNSDVSEMYVIERETVNLHSFDLTISGVPSGGKTEQANVLDLNLTSPIEADDEIQTLNFRPAGTYFYVNAKLKYEVLEFLLADNFVNGGI